MFSFVSFAWMTLDKSVRRPSDRVVSWSTPCRESQALKERFNKSYAKRAVTSFFKSYPCPHSIFDLRDENVYPNFQRHKADYTSLCIFLHSNSLANSLILSLSEYTTYEPPRDKTNKMSVRPEKTQISLDIRQV